jgi:DNA-binding transcriptional regulator/RsmH inhibitor MraZ
VVKTSPADNLATLYSGRARNAVDNSNRVMLPADWRGKGAPARFFVLAEGDHLLVCPAEIWGATVAELRGATADKTLIPDIERELNRRACQVSLDRFGRLPLPREFTTALGIQGHADLLGRYSKFEIWSIDKPAQPTAASAAAAALVAEKLKYL